MKLTKRAIDAMQYEGDGTSRDVRWDDELRGFGVRVYPSGQKAFVLSYRAQGRKRLMTIGAYGVQTVDRRAEKRGAISLMSSAPTWTRWRRASASPRARLWPTSARPISSATRSWSSGLGATTSAASMAASFQNSAT